jgi:hypothetical protein
MREVAAGVSPTVAEADVDALLSVGQLHVYATALIADAQLHCNRIA